MERKEREWILGEGGIRDENPIERRRRLAVDRDLEGSPLRGKPLRRRYRNAAPSVDGYVASLGGPLPYMVRLREIELRTADHQRELERAWRGLGAECRGDAAAFEERWRRLAGRWDFGVVNDLIDRHNRYYPAEARLPMNPRTGDFALVNGRPYRRRPLGADWVLERYPPALGRVAA